VKHKTCKERINDEYTDRIDTIESIFDRIDDGHNDNDDGAIDAAYNELDYMALDPQTPLEYIPSDTWDGQDDGFIRWHLSWGGPEDQFRFFIDEHGGITNIEYHFMDWFDGAVINVNMTGYHAELLDRVFDLYTGGCPLHLIKDYQEAI